MSKTNDILNKEIDIKNILKIIALFLVIGSYGFFVIYPKYNEYISLKSQIQEAESQLEQYTQKVDNVATLKNEYENINTKVKQMSLQLSHNMEDGMFLIGLNKNINKLGIELKNYMIDDVIEYDTFYAIPTTITLRGNYTKVKKIMSYMEEQKNMTQILDFNLKLAPVEIPEPQVIPAEKDEEGNIIKPEVVIPPTIPKNTGDVDAVFKFIMYSSDDANIVLDYDNSTTWKSGKLNPFVPIQ